MVCTGLMERARPSCAICASLLACALVSLASVATTPIVVAAPGWKGAGNSPARMACIVSSSAVPSALRAPATGRPLDGSITSPSAFTATSAPTVMPAARTEAEPMPPFIARAMP